MGSELGIMQRTYYGHRSVRAPLDKEQRCSLSLMEDNDHCNICNALDHHRRGGSPLSCRIPTPPPAIRIRTHVQASCPAANRHQSGMAMNHRRSKYVVAVKGGMAPRQTATMQHERPADRLAD